MTPTVIWDAVAGFARAVNAILSVIPALVWAIALALALGYSTVMHHERDTAVSARNVVKAMYEQLTTKVIRQKNEAAALLKKLTAERDALQVQLNTATEAQRKKDAENAKTIADQKRRLADLNAAGGGRLRDPNAGRGCSCPGAQGATEAPAASGAGHPAEAGGLLSKELSGLLLRLTGEADDINAAYESARADALICRQAMGASP